MATPDPDRARPADQRVDVDQLVARLEALLGSDAPSDSELPTPLDRLVAVVDGVDPHAPGESATVEALDRLADGCDPGSGPDRPRTVLTHVFDTLGFIGAQRDYHAPANSLLHRVIERRRGIPLSLAIVIAEIGRRVSVDLRPVGFPRHVLVGEGATPTRWFDPFSGGTELSLEDCRALYDRFGLLTPFDPSMLQPMEPADVVVRTLNNLRTGHLRNGVSSDALPVLELRSRISGPHPVHGRELIEWLMAFGRFEQAAEHLERMARVDPGRAEAHTNRALALRARWN
jgi:regulator of sirC expression with transglutaminase-like and TPR domain